MGLFGGLMNATGLQLANIEANPEQAAVGANTPESTYALNKAAGPTMNKHYTPTLSMTGGYTQGQMQENAREGYSNTGPAVANAVGDAVAEYMTAGAATPLIMGQAAADQYARSHPYSNFNQEYSGIVAASPSINQGIYNYNNQGVYAKGGAVGLHNTAHYLKSKGRNDDTELVHMTKSEVQALKGLAAKHGGNLTTNPHTGLPEAGFLSSVLPMVAGIGLDILTDGALTPLLSGMLVGGADYAITGSISKGLMAGLGAYGGAGLSDALGDLGEQAFDKAATENLQQLNPQVDPNEFAREMGTPGFNMPATPMVPPSAAGSVMSGLGQATSSLGSAGSFLADNSGYALSAAAPVLSDALSPKRSAMPVASTASTNPYGLKTLSPDFKGTFPAQPNPAYVAQYPNYRLNPYKPGVPNTLYPSQSGTVYAADGGLMQGGPANVDFMGGDMYPQSQIQRSYYATPTQAPTSAQQTMASYEPQTNPLTGEPTANMASGGIASYSGKYGSIVAMNEATQDLEDLFGPRKIIHSDTPGVGIVQDTDPNTRNLDAYSAALYRINQKAKAAGLGKGTVALAKPTMKLGDINPDNTTQSEDLASGGITSLGGYASGGNPRLLRGPGDGMSDSIPASIGGKQPARLADGEFVVPADVVSHLGNGSTDAGAKKLYSMMDKIRSARTGRKKQAPAVKADKYIPK